jgi:hypothetical protein
MLSLIRGILSIWNSGEKFVHYTTEVVVLKNRKLQVINARFKKGIESGNIFIMMADNKWKNIEDVFGEKSIPRIRRKSEKFVKLPD